MRDPKQECLSKDCTLASRMEADQGRKWLKKKVRKFLNVILDEPIC